MGERPMSSHRRSAFKVQNLRTERVGTALARFDLVLGDEDETGMFFGVLVIFDLALRARRAGGCWVQLPGAPRRDKDGRPVLDERGRTRFDTRIALHRPGPGQKPTELAVAFMKAVTAETISLLDASVSNREIRPAWPTEGTAKLFRARSEHGGSLHGDGLFGSAHGSAPRATTQTS